MKGNPVRGYVYILITYPGYASRTTGLPMEPAFQAEKDNTPDTDIPT